jgi:hypothetical protein
MFEWMRRCVALLHTIPVSRIINVAMQYPRIASNAVVLDKHGTKRHHGNLRFYRLPGLVTDLISKLQLPFFFQLLFILLFSLEC